MPYNRGMNRLDLLLPFSLTPPELARDLQKELSVPSLAMLLGRGKSTAMVTNDAFSRTLPHEAWLFENAAATSTDNSPPLARYLAHDAGMSLDEGFWFILQPFHLHVARDHLVLTDPRQLRISEEESQALFSSAQSVFSEDGKDLFYVSPSIWLLRADDWHGLRTSTPDAACGHNVDIWTPQGDRAREWRRLQNEVQMHWHDHAVNDARTGRGLKPINSVWLWGGAKAGTSTMRRFETAFSSTQSTPLLAALQTRQISDASTLLSTSAGHAILVLDDLSEPALTEDWAEWIARMNSMEERWFAPLLAALRQGQLKQLGITLNHHATLKTIDISKSALRKFWKKPALTALAA
ncbi:hypothetical protein GCM10008066_10560 [Oxalicibacterium faecigallinarum]|uniref:Phosphoglycerate mutase n=2 Tax=Oxalicibacterium faecigallinarum TaxID=573741 RepID=A0A8J3AS12_9BURK|nr:hypothetical protein GCM10008066_10560 [Oxalicibacterium faecigallinarum]